MVTSKAQYYVIYIQFMTDVREKNIHTAKIYNVSIHGKEYYLAQIIIQHSFLIIIQYKFVCFLIFRCIYKFTKKRF